MPQYLDQYFLVENRNREFVLDFLNKYIPKRNESAVDYPIPQYDEKSTIIFNDAEELLMYLEDNREIEYSIYWQNLNLDSMIQYLMAFYTDDGKLIVGVSIKRDHPEGADSLALYKELKSFLNSKISCITSEEPPPMNSKEFYVFAEERYPNKYNV